jgi:peptidoglycan hydrolase CwlO-like protein
MIAKLQSEKGRMAKKISKKEQMVKILDSKLDSMTNKVKNLETELTDLRKTIVDN